MAKKEIKKVGNILTPKEVNRKYSGSGMANEIIVLPDDVLWLPSKNLYLNYTLGGGIPYGKICEIFGGESSGKSLVALDFSSVAHSLGGVVLLNDAEQAFDPIWAEKNGLDLSRTAVYNETSIERVSDWSADMAVTWRNQLVNNEPILFICDSIAALDCEANINSSQSDAKAEMGNRAKALYRFLRTRNQLYAELGITLIFINQLRKKVGATRFEDPDETPGGMAMRFYASQRLAFFQKARIREDIRGKECWVGNTVSVRLKKNKVAPPRPSFTTEIYFHEEYGKIGFDKYSNLPELFERTGVVTKKAGGVYYIDDNKIARGEDNFAEMVEGDPEFRANLLKKANINTISKTRKKLKKLEELGINRYPVKPSSKKRVRQSIQEDGEDE